MRGPHDQGFGSRALFGGIRGLRLGCALNFEKTDVIPSAASSGTPSRACDTEPAHRCGRKVRPTRRCPGFQWFGLANLKKSSLLHGLKGAACTIRGTRKRGSVSFGRPNRVKKMEPPGHWYWTRCRCIHAARRNRREPGRGRARIGRPSPESGGSKVFKNTCVLRARELDPGFSKLSESSIRRIPSRSEAAFFFLYKAPLRFICTAIRGRRTSRRPTIGTKARLAG